MNLSGKTIHVKVKGSFQKGAEILTIRPRANEELKVVEGSIDQVIATDTINTVLFIIDVKQVKSKSETLYIIVNQMMNNGIPSYQLVSKEVYQNY
jgi:hypothetical protein